MGWMSMWVLIVLFRISCRLFGNCWCVVGVSWLCMYMMDVSDVSVYW